MAKKREKIISEETQKLISFIEGVIKGLNNNIADHRSHIKLLTQEVQYLKEIKGVLMKFG